MSNAFLTLVAPFLTILIVWLGSTISNRQGLRTLEAKIDGLEKKMDARFEAVNARFDSIDQRLSRLETTVDRIDNEIRKDHEHRITVLEAQVRQLQSSAA